MTDTLKELVEKARALPEQVAELTAQLAAKRQALHDLLAGQKEIEAQVMAEVAAEGDGNGRKKYPNEEARKGEVARRLKADTRYQAIEKELARVRLELVELETNLERARYEFRAANTLLTLLASAVQAGRPDIEQAVLDGNQSTPKAATNGTHANGREQHLQNFANAVNAVANGHPAPRVEEPRKQDTEELEVEVLEVRPGSKEGTFRFWCDTPDGKQAVFAKNSVADKLMKSLGRKVVVKARKLDNGWFAVAVK